MSLTPKVLAEKQDYVNNPLQAHRNVKCPCGSGIKAKHCCGQIRYVKKYLSIIIERYISKDLEKTELEYIREVFRREKEDYKHRVNLLKEQHERESKQQEQSKQQSATEAISDTASES